MVDTPPIPDIPKPHIRPMPEPQPTAQGMEPPHPLRICILGGPRDLWVARVVKEGARCRGLMDLHPLAEQVDLHLQAVPPARLAATRVAAPRLPPWEGPQGRIPEATAKCTNFRATSF